MTGKMRPEFGKRISVSVLVLALTMPLPGCGKLIASGNGLFGESPQTCRERVHGVEVQLWDADTEDEGRGYLYTPADTASVLTTARRIGFDLNEVRDGTSMVPRLYAADLPPDIGEDHAPEARKVAFVVLMLPLVLRANEKIEKDRRVVEIAVKCFGDRDRMPIAMHERLNELHEQYGSKGDQKVLLRRLDKVPPSLAIAQAAIESGWGTSRMAQEGNALFGQRTRHPSRAIMARKSGVLVAVFSSPMESVRAYIHMLNTNVAFKDFRKQRAEQRLIADRLYGPELSQSLVKYSIRRDAYVVDLWTLMINNEFDRLDRSQLADDAPLSAEQTVVGQL